MTEVQQQHSESWCLRNIMMKPPSYLEFELPRTLSYCEILILCEITIIKDPSRWLPGEFHAAKKVDSIQEAINSLRRLRSQQQVTPPPLPRYREFTFRLTAGWFKRPAIIRIRQFQEVMLNLPEFLLPEAAMSKVSKQALLAAKELVLSRGRVLASAEFFRHQKRLNLRAMFGIANDNIDDRLLVSGAVHSLSGEAVRRVAESLAARAAEVAASAASREGRSRLVNVLAHRHEILQLTPADLPPNWRSLVAAAAAAAAAATN